jgi:opacity protein-like surface antigen
MKKLSFLLSCLALAALSTAAATAATASLTVKLSAENGSGENGTATLTQAGSDVKVVIDIPHGPAGPQPAHIHDGTCAGILGVAYGLGSVANGSSTTVLKGLTIDQLLAGKYAINVHKSTSDMGNYVTCGNIVKPSSM